MSADAPVGLEGALPAAHLIARQVAAALDEDLGSGDRTAALLPGQQQARVDLITRQEAVICGRAWFDEVFRQIDERVRPSWRVADGDSAGAGSRLCRLEGPSRALLSGERTAMNFLQTLSGTATRARRYADAVAGLPVRVLDTRKTIPGLRLGQQVLLDLFGQVEGFLHPLALPEPFSHLVDDVAGVADFVI